MTVVSWLRQMYALGIRLSVKDGKLQLSQPIPEHFAYLRFALESLEPAIIDLLESDQYSVCQPKMLHGCGYEPDAFCYRFAVPAWAVELFSGGQLREGKHAKTACIGILFDQALHVSSVRTALTHAVRQMPWLTLQWWRDSDAEPWQSWGAGLPVRPYIDFEYVDISADPSAASMELSDLTETYGCLELAFDESPTLHRLIKLDAERYGYLFCYWPGLCRPQMALEFVRRLFMIQRRVGSIVDQGHSNQLSLSLSSVQADALDVIQHSWADQLWHRLVVSTQPVLDRMKYELPVKLDQYTEQQSLVITRHQKHLIETKVRESLMYSDSELSSVELWSQLLLGVWSYIMSEYYPRAQQIPIEWQLTGFTSVKADKAGDDEDLASDEWLSTLTNLSQTHYQVAHFPAAELAGVDISQLLPLVRRLLTRSHVAMEDNESDTDDVPKCVLYVVPLQADGSTDQQSTTQRVFELLCTRSQQLQMAVPVANELQMWVIVGTHSVRLELFYNPARTVAGTWLHQIGQQLQRISQEVILPSLTDATSSERHPKKHAEERTPAFVRPHLLSVLYNQVMQHPEAIAVSVENTVLSYRQLWIWAQYGAAQLRKAGLGADQWVAIEGRLGVELMVGVLATLLSGAAYIVLSPDWPKRVRRQMAQQANIQAWIGAQCDMADGQDDMEGVPFISISQWRLGSQSVDAYVPESLAVETPAFASFNVFSDHALSAVEMSYGVFSSQLLGWIQAQPMHKNAALQVRIPLTVPAHADGFHRQWAMALATGGTLFIDEQFVEHGIDRHIEERLPNAMSVNDSDHNCDLDHRIQYQLSRLDQWRINYIEAPVSQWQDWLSANKQLSAVPEGLNVWQSAFSLVQLAVLTPGHWQLTQLQALVESLPLVKVDVLVAMTLPEAVAPIRWYRVGAEPLRQRRSQWCVGAHSLQESQLVLLDAYQRPAPQEVEGQLYLEAESLSDGYVHQRGLDAKKWISHPLDLSKSLFETGIRGRLDRKGRLWLMPYAMDFVYIHHWWVSLSALQAAFSKVLDLVDLVLIVRNDRLLAAGEWYYCAYWVDQPGRERSWHQLARELATVWPSSLIPKQGIKLSYLPSKLKGNVEPSRLRQGMVLTNTILWQQASANRQVISHDFWSKRLANVTAFPAGSLANVGQSATSNRFITAIQRTRERRQFQVPVKVLSLVKRCAEACQVVPAAVWATAMQAALQWLWPKQIWPMACLTKSQHSLGSLVLSPAQPPIQWVTTLARHWQQAEAYLPACMNWVNTVALQAYPQWANSPADISDQTEFEPMIPIGLAFTESSADAEFVNRYGVCWCFTFEEKGILADVSYVPSWFQATQIDMMLQAVLDWLDYAVGYPHQPVKYFYQSLMRIDHASHALLTMDKTARQPRVPGTSYPLTPQQEAWLYWESKIVDVSMASGIELKPVSGRQTAVQQIQSVLWQGVCLDITGTFNLQSWQTALDDQVGAYVALRTQLIPVYSDHSLQPSAERNSTQWPGWGQLILENVDAVLNCEDWRGRVHNLAQLNAEIDRMVVESKPLVLSPLQYFYAIQWAPECWRLLVISHPLAIDEMGLQRFMMSWVHAQQRWEQGQHKMEPSEDEYSAFIKWSEVPARSRIGVAELAAEQAKLKFHGVMLAATPEQPDICEEQKWLSVEFVSRLQQKAQQEGISIDWVIQAFYLILLLAYVSVDNALVLYIRQDNRFGRYRRAIGSFSGYRAFQAPLALLTDKQVTLADIWILLRRWVASSHQGVALPRLGDPGLYGFFAFQDAREPVLINGQHVEPAFVDHGYLDNSLVLSARLNEGSMRLCWRYPKQGFKSFHFLSRLSLLLEQWLIGTERLADFELLLPQEKSDQALVWGKGNRRIANWPPMPRLLEEQVQRTPQRIAVQQGEASLTFWQLDQLANQIASRLVKLGCQLGETVMLCTGDKLHLPAAMLGILKVGANFIPVDLSLTQTHWQQAAQDCGVKLVLTSARLKNRYEAFSADLTVIALDQFDANTQMHFLSREVSSQTPVYVVYRTFLHGPARKVFISSESLANLVQWYCSELGLKPEDRILLLATMDFHIAQKNIWASLVTGAKLVVGESHVYDPEQVVKDIEQHQITRFSTTPSAFYPILNTQALQQKGSEVLRSLTTLILGKEPVKLSAIRPFLTADHECAVLCTYNIRVCTDVVAYHWLSQECMADYVPIGRPINRVQLFVMDRLDRLQPGGLIGQVAILGPCVGQLAGDVGVDHQHAFVTIPDTGRLFYTGDLACYDEKGALSFVGRQNGERPVRDTEVSIQQIEQRLMTFPGVVDAHVFDQGDQMIARLRLLDPENFRPDTFKNKLAWLYPDARLPDIYEPELEASVTADSVSDKPQMYDELTPTKIAETAS